MSTIKSSRVRTDCHVHLDKVVPTERVPSGDRARRIAVEIDTPQTTIDDLQDYTQREELGLIGGIYELDATLRRFLNSKLPIFPLFWERDPKNPNIPNSARGLKLHPFMDRFVLASESVGPTMDIATQRQMPVLIHSEDREPDLSRGRFFADIAKKYPDVPIIIGHGGSYAPVPTLASNAVLVEDFVVRKLVAEAIDAVAQSPNVFLEVSTLAHHTKVQLIAKTAPVEKLLIGSDYPISKDKYGSAVFQENALLTAGLSDADIEQIRANAFSLMRPSA